ncbi:hypothetical protein Pint_06406 [Pistacia integerrima]|uniref:Uncharacterized protein n=1 Tax=Pistacia integerrima TaxID=434235 RepID=A0ACC0ZA37_9ROSI|nr:hypothetical protein Pint_06406 [Pistacia integerrima]
MEDHPHSPHLLIFPLPIQGHLNSMLKLAELLSLQGLSITFLNSHHSHKRLLRYTDIHARFAQYPGFRFKTFSDGLPDDHPRTSHQITEMFDALYLSARPFLKKMLIDTLPPVSCIIGDGILGFVPDVAKELKIPLIHFRTVSACSIWAYFCIPLLIQAGNIPLRGRHQDMDRLITTVPGMEAFLRGRDLPGICKDNDINDRIFQFVLDATLKSSEVDVLLLNTFEDLEGPMLSHIRTKKALEELLIDLRPPVSCIIGDPILGFVSDVAKELKIPLIHFYIASACSFWTSLCTPDVIEAGELPLKGYEDLDSLITTVPGMETFLRGRDLPSFCRPNDINDPIFQQFMDWILKSSETNALILNTFEDLEAPILSHIRTKRFSFDRNYQGFTFSPYITKLCSLKEKKIGHLNPMLKLVEFLSLASLNITFLKHNHKCLLRYSGIQARFAQYPGFRFKTFCDGLAAHHPRTADRPIEIFDGMNLSARHFRAASFWATLCIPDVIQAGELPLKGNEDMDRLITAVPGMETFLCGRDLPGFFRANDIDDPIFQLGMNRTLKPSSEADGLLLNTSHNADHISHAILYEDVYLIIRMFS